MKIKNNKYSAFWNLFFPSRCCCCGELTEDRALICQTCLSKLSYIPIDCCTGCGQAHKDCECKHVNMLFSGITVPFYNDGVAKEGIYSLKFKGYKDNAQFFGVCIAERFLEHFKDVKLDLVTAVPMSRMKKLKRGFNHAEVLAKVVAEQLGVKYNGRIIKKRDKSSVAQHELSYRERIRHVKDIYRVNGDFQGKTILLVDDIRTTSATLNACTKQLLLAGAEKVYCTAALITNNAEKLKNIKVGKKEEMK